MGLSEKGEGIKKKEKTKHLYIWITVLCSPEGKGNGGRWERAKRGNVVEKDLTLGGACLMHYADDVL